MLLYRLWLRQKPILRVHPCVAATDIRSVREALPILRTGSGNRLNLRRSLPERLYLPARACLSGIKRT